MPGCELLHSTEILGPGTAPIAEVFFAGRVAILRGLMVAPPSPRSLLRLFAALAVAGCAGAPALPRVIAIAPGELTTVQLLQVDGKLTLSLQNESAGLAKDVYVGNSADPGRKVVADADLQALLDVFAADGMFAQVVPHVPPDARDVLTVQSGGRSWTWVRRQRGVQQGEAVFHEARAYFLALYNSNIAYHGTGRGRPDFERESSRVQVDAAAATDRLRELRRAR